ncbi:MAG: hypothetical protein ABII88_03025 [Candidatus Omnitrophota bacterium]
MNNIKTIFIFCTIISFFLAGCDNLPFMPDKFQMIKGPDGAIYKLNKKTGEITVIKSGSFVAEDLSVNQTDAPGDGSDDDSGYASLDTSEMIAIELANPREWTERQINGKNLKAKLTTYWKEGNFYYHFTVAPYASLKKMMERKEKDVYYRLRKHGFIIKFIDGNEFVIKELTLLLTDMDKVLDQKDNTIALETNESVALGMRECAQIRDFLLTADLDWMTIPNYKFDDKVKDLIQTYNCYGEVNSRVDLNAPPDAKYWWMTYPEKKKIYFSTEEELINSYEKTISRILEDNQ